MLVQVSGGEGGQSHIERRQEELCEFDVFVSIPSSIMGGTTYVRTSDGISDEHGRL